MIDKTKNILIYGKNHGKSYRQALITAKKAIEISEFGKFKVNIEVKSSQIEDVQQKLKEILEILNNEEKKNTTFSK